ncbi:DUF3149 domain-containing protein [Gallaecimonas sp. GXIMD1310]
MNHWMQLLFGDAVGIATVATILGSVLIIGFCVVLFVRKAMKDGDA